MCPVFPVISSHWAVTCVVSVQLLLPCPFKTFKMHSVFFVTGASASEPAQRSCCPVSLVSSPPRMHCVCALVRVAGAGSSAVLGSLSLPTLIPLLPLGAGGRGAHVLPGRGLYLTPFVRCWALTCLDVVWLLSCVFWSLF